MKYNHMFQLKIPIHVAPYAGAWIEIEIAGIALETENVAPYAGAWIEMRRINSSKRGE